MTNGIYALLLDLPQNVVVNTRRKVFTLEAGYYTYIGSAMNGLEARICRHKSAEKRKHWHIDYLLEKGAIIGVLSAVAQKRHECEVAGFLTGLTCIPGFGCSDCRCRSHLFLHESASTLFKTTDSAFRQAGLSPMVKFDDSRLA